MDLPTGSFLLCSVFFVLLLANSEASHVVLGTNFGKLIGEKISLSDGTNIYSFRGVPYANPLSNIFDKATKVHGWYEPRRALKLESACLYTPYAYSDENLVKSDYDTSSDCLYLNIYTPSIPTDPIKLTKWDELMYGDVPLPVMVYFPNDIVAQAFEPLELVAQQKLVVVVVNYRVGPLGYACTGSIGNRALDDQRLSLDWIQDTIHSFHGDPSRVTVLANGAAALDASLHLFSSGTKAMFSRIWLSSLDITNIEHQLPGQATSDFLQAVGCHSVGSDQLLSCLGNVPEENITQWYDSYDKQHAFKPCVDGIVLTAHPLSLYHRNEWMQDVDVVIGFPIADICDDLDEPLSLEHMESLIGNLLDKYGVSSEKQQVLLPQLPELYQFFDGNSYRVKLCEITTDISITTPSTIQADFHSGRNSTASSADNSRRGKVYMYELSYRHSRKITPTFVDSTRGDDLQSVLGVPCSDRVPTNSSPNDCEISEQMMSRAGNFMRTGNPNSHNTVHIWPEYYNKHSPETKLLSIRDPMFSKVVRNHKQDLVNFWKKYVFDNLDLSSISSKWEGLGNNEGEGQSSVERGKALPYAEGEEIRGEGLREASTSGKPPHAIPDTAEVNPTYTQDVREEYEDDVTDEDTVLVVENKEGKKDQGSKVDGVTSDYGYRKDEL